MLHHIDHIPLLQPRSDDFQDLLGSLARILHILCDNLPRLRVMRLGGDTTVDDHLLVFLFTRNDQ